MSNGNTVDILDKDAFPSKVTSLRSAASDVRTKAAALAQIIDAAEKEAASFTVDGTPAPVYNPLLESLRTWWKALASSVAATCESADNCADTAEAKFNGIVAVDSHAAAAIQNISAGGPAPVSYPGPGPGTTGTQTGQAGTNLTPEQLANPGLTSAPSHP